LRHRGGNSALTCAVYGGHVLIVKFLLKQWLKTKSGRQLVNTAGALENSFLNRKNDIGRAAIHFAAELDDFRKAAFICESLLRCKVPFCAIETFETKLS
jgi:hypothetical protein